MKHDTVTIIKHQKKKTKNGNDIIICMIKKAYCQCVVGASGTELRLFCSPLVLARNRRDIFASLAKKTCTKSTAVHSVVVGISTASFTATLDNLPQSTDAADLCAASSETTDSATSLATERHQ